MSEHRERKKKKKKASSLLDGSNAENELSSELAAALDEMEKERQYVDIQICPKCKGPLVRRVGSMSGDMSGHMGLTPPKYECRECGWRERLVLKITNRPTRMKDVVMMAEAKDAADERSG